LQRIVAGAAVERVVAAVAGDRVASVLPVPPMFALPVSVGFDRRTACDGDVALQRIDAR